jgi:beta-glucosidase
MPNDPQFSLGHGLSYSAFSCTDPQITVGDAIRVDATVTNESARAGITTLFLFAHDPVASVSRPLLELKRFQSIALGAHETKSVRFALERSDFAFPDQNLRDVIEPGEIEIHVGFSADPAQLKSTSFALT